MQQRYVVLLLAVVVVAFMYMAYIIKTSDVNASSLGSQVLGMSQQPRLAVSNHFMGEKRYPVVKKAPSPNRLPFQTGVYLKFDTSKYTDMDGRIFIPSDTVLKQMSFGEIEELYYRYIENIQILCPRSRHIGNDEDGGYHVCEPVLPRDCLAYSFGESDSFYAHMSRILNSKNRKDYSFDDGLAAHYNCEVHGFDPNDGQPDHQHSELVAFHKLGISGKDEVTPKRWTLKTLDSIRTVLNHSDRPLDLLKIDTEGAEWNCLPQILEEKTLDKAHVKILIVEFHMLFTPKDLNAYMTALHTLKGIYDAGFRIYYFHIWTTFCLVTDPKTKRQRAFCHEVHFMRA